MIRRFSALVAALLFGLTMFAPSAADARDRRGYHDRGYHYGRYDHHRRHDHGDAVAAGAVGLILGLALGSMASQPREPSCYDNYQRCAPPPPPPPCRNPCGYDDSYYRQDPRDDDRYYDEGSAYERDYGYDPYDDDQPREQCMRQERQWDRYANRYVTVDVPC